MVATAVFFALIARTFGCIPTLPPNPVCCSTLSLNTVPRIAPIGAYSGFDQCAILTYHNNQPCPSTGNIVCQIAPLSDASTAYLQLLKGSTVVYAAQDAQQTDVFVTCSNGNWVYEGTTFTSVSCSQN